MEINKPLSIAERMEMKLKTLYALVVALKYAFLYPVTKGPKPLFRTFVNNAIIRTLLGLSTPRQLYHAVPRTLDTYRAWTKRTGQSYDVESIKGADGIETNLMWIGGKWSPGSTRKVVFYVHGGGYELPLSLGHMDLCLWVRDQVVKSGNEGPAIALLEYGCTPKYQYPSQLRQAVVALGHLLESGLPPSSMVLAGDSAGGNLLLSVMSHILHPHPSIPELKLPSAAFPALLLFSPAVTCSTDSAGSMQSCAKLDLLNPKLYARWISMYKNGTSMDREISEGGFWGSALEAPEEWWAGLEKVTSEICVTAGGCEIFRDNIVRFVEQMRRIKGGPRFELFVGEKETHDAPLDDFSNQRPPNGSTKLAAEWVIRALY